MVDEKVVAEVFHFFNFLLLNHMVHFINFLAINFNRPGKSRLEQQCSLSSSTFYYYTIISCVSHRLLMVLLILVLRVFRL